MPVTENHARDLGTPINCALFLVGAPATGKNGLLGRGKEYELPAFPEELRHYIVDTHNEGLRQEIEKASERTKPKEFHKLQSLDDLQAVWTSKGPKKRGRNSLTESGSQETAPTKGRHAIGATLRQAFTAHDGAPSSLKHLNLILARSHRPEASKLLATFAQCVMESAQHRELGIAVIGFDPRQRLFDSINWNASG